MSEEESVYRTQLRRAWNLIFKCPYCRRTYLDQESLEGHKNANHWKRMKWERK